MSTIVAMAGKDLRLLSRDWLAMFFILGFPVLMALFFGAMYGNVESGNASLGVAVVDEDKSEMSKKFVENLQETGNVVVTPLDRPAAVERVRRGEQVGFIALSKGFGETAGLPWRESPAIELGIDPSRKAETGMLEGLVMQSAGKLMMDRFQNPTAMRPFIQQGRDEIEKATDISPALKPALAQMMESLDEFMVSWEHVESTEAESKANAGKEADDDLAAGFQLARIETVDVTRQIAPDSSQALVKKLRSKWDITFPQAMLWGILACAASFATSIVHERKQGTFLRLQVAPVTRRQILLGKAAACFAAVLGVIGLMVALGTWMGMRPQNPGLLALAAASIAFCFVGIMMLMSVIGKSEEAVSGAAWSANMLMAMFGGGMIPLVFMPSFMRTLSNFSPAKWSVLALEGAIWRGFSFAEMLTPLAVLFAIGAVCLAIGATVLTRASD